MGHGRIRRRRQIRKSNKLSAINQSEQSQTQSKPSNVTVTRSGRKIQPPARFNQVASPRGSPKKEGGVVESGCPYLRIYKSEDHVWGSLSEVTSEVAA